MQFRKMRWVAIAAMLVIMVSVTGCSRGGPKLIEEGLVGVWTDAGGGGIYFAPGGAFESSIFYSTGTYQIDKKANTVFLVNTYREYVTLTPSYDEVGQEWELNYQSEDSSYSFHKSDLTQLEERSENDYFLESIAPKILGTVQQVLPAATWFSDGASGVTFSADTLQFWNQPPCAYSVRDAHWPDTAGYGDIDFDICTPEKVYTARLSETVDEYGNLNGYTLSIFNEGALFVSVLASDVVLLTEGA